MQKTDQTTQIDRILDFWLGNSVNAEMPSPQRTQLWFASDQANIATLHAYFDADLHAARQGAYSQWQASARGSLALIILLEIIPKRIYQDQFMAYQDDARALDICQAGIARGLDHQLTLIERVFYYMPLQEAEDLAIQRQSVAVYQTLVDYSLTETKVFYQTFLALALHNFEVIEQFGRFPERNLALGRQATSRELAYLRI